ncbi:MAG: efflux RND transporter permease subunit [bacterium]|nr:efflux RND transporter permease subunit [bacterium]
MISKFSVKKPYTVLVGVVLVIVLGIVSLTRMTTDLLPDMDMPYAIVMTTYAGASPEEVEKEVTAPIEGAMATTSNIKSVSSTSYDNYSVVILEYEQTANMDSVLIEMQQKLDQLKGNWKDTVGAPMIMQLDPDMMPVMVASADIEGMSQSEISEYVENTLVPSLESIEGVATVTTTGALTENLQVTMNKDKIDALNKKIQKKIEGQFTEQEDKLTSSSNEIKEGQDKLQDGKDQLSDKMSSSTNEIINQKIELSKQETELANKLEELKANKKSMTAAIESLQTAYDGATKLENAISQLKTLQESLPAVRQGAVAALLTQNPQATEEMQKQAGDAAISNMLASLKEKTGYDITSEEQLKATVDSLQENLDKINESLQQQAATFADAGVSMTSYKDIPTAVSTLSKTLTEINKGIATIEAGQKKISEGKTSLDQALVTLNETEIKSILEMSESSSKLEAASSQITDGQNQLNEAKENAKNSADLNTVLTLDNLNNLLVAQNFSMPAGYAGTGEDKYLVRIGNKVTSETELKDLVLVDLGMDGIDPIKVSDVAEITTIDDSADTYSKVNGNPAIMLSFEKQTGYSTGDVTDRLLDKFDSLEQQNADLNMSVMMNQGVYIDIIVQSVMENMIVGAILAIIVLLLFLKDIKPTLIIACSIPLSVIFAIVLMYFSNISLNIISLSGLALGIGMLVDNSIVVIENIYRLRNEGLTIRKAAVQGASQVTGAIVASTLTTVCVFAPIIFTEGITRQLFVDIALTIAFTLAASLLVALTFVPMMAAGLLKNTKEIKHGFLERVQGGYEFILRKSMKFKAIVFIVGIILLVISAKAALSRGFSFMDMNMSTDQLSVTIAPKEGETLTFDELISQSDQVMEKLSGIEGIKDIGAMAGGGGMLSSMGGGSADSVSMYLVLEETAKGSNQKIIDQVNELTKDMNCEVSTSSSASGVSSFMGSGISVEIKGNDLDKLQELAAKVADVVKDTEGTEKVQDGLDDTTPSFTIVVDKDKAAEYGMTVAQVFQIVHKEMASSTSATTITTDTKDYEVYVQSEEQSHVTIEDIKKLTFSHTDREGKKKDIPLSKIAKFETGTSLNNIKRDAQVRTISVTSAIKDGYNVSLVSNDIQKNLKSIEIPDGYSINMAGEDEQIKEAMNQLVLMLVLAIVFIYLVMVAQFQSLLSPFIIMFTIPLAFTGGLFALYFTGNEVSVVGMIGFVMLAGIIVNNGIVMVDYINQLRREGMDKKEAIVEAGKTRLRPILMTALTTILAMSTMALGLGSGSEMMQPMAIVTVGGLIYGTILTLIVVPCIYDAFNRNKSMVEEEL